MRYTVAVEDEMTLLESGSMATVKERTKGKSGFLKEFFVDHADGGKAAIDKAWRQAGNDDSISTSLIHKIRGELGLTGKRKTKAKAKRKRASAARSVESSANTAQPAATDQDQMLIRLEGEIDGILQKIMRAGGFPEFEETLRQARRLLVRSHTA
jgi:hypothetical protein